MTVAQNFDSLGFPVNHPGRSRSDTYYINADTVLRTHTSAHQADTFRKDASEGYTISADVYRRDAIDRNHNPVFHQMEGARMWDRRKVLGGDVAQAVWEDLDQMPKPDLIVEDDSPTVHPQRNPLQQEHHTTAEVEAMAAHLKRTLEGLIFDILFKARASREIKVRKTRKAAPRKTKAAPLKTKAAPLKTKAAPLKTKAAPLKTKIRWVETHFPFTSPSWELEVFWEDKWLELLGCGIVQQRLPIAAGVPSQLGWAFGIGLERVAMLLFGVPDIRLFWSRDDRFLSQFTTLDNIRPFVPYSKYPACSKDMSFYLRSTSTDLSRGIGGDFHENDIMEIVRETIGGQLVEDVQLLDDYRAPSGRRSLCYRVRYRSFERTLTNAEVNLWQMQLGRQLESTLGVEIRP